MCFTRAGSWCWVGLCGCVFGRQTEGSWLLDPSTIQQPLQDPEAAVGSVFMRYAPRFSMCVRSRTQCIALQPRLLQPRLCDPKPRFPSWCVSASPRVACMSATSTTPKTNSVPMRHWTASTKSACGDQQLFCAAPCAPVYGAPPSHGRLLAAVLVLSLRMLCVIFCCASADATAFFTELQRLPRCSGNTIRSFLIMPVQRVPRYRLLIAVGGVPDKRRPHRASFVSSHTVLLNELPGASQANEA